jgi:chemotaxis protein histidine kinase CheA
MQTVFADTACSSDLLSQIETTCAACIGEDAMNFEFNAHLLPTEITRTFADGPTKILDLNWSPISDDTGTTLRLLLCVRDVTELRALAAQANDQKRELAIIGEILAVPQEKFHAFVQGAQAFLNDNRSILESNRPSPMATAREATITELFRNMHTIKGNARTYGLLRLTHVVHDAEQAYDQLRKDAQLDWNCDSLLQQLDQVCAVVEEYNHISETKLGRKGAGRRGGAERFLMVEKTDLDATKQLLDSADSSSPAALRDALRQARHSLELIGTSRLPDVLSGVLESLPSLAHELGKEAPKCVIEDNAIAVRNQAVDMLRNVYMHLYRNALDHGLEQGAVRMAQGKAAVGTIRLTAAIRADQLVLSLQDDGRGLALTFIRKRALENGVVGADDVLSDQETAQLIFKPGFSTAEQVTEVSGRGVGMDAVRGFVQAAGGSIELQLQGDATTGGYQAFATVIRLPASLAVAPVLHLLQNVA